MRPPPRAAGEPDSEALVRRLAEACGEADDRLADVVHGDGERRRANLRLFRARKELSHHGDRAGAS